MEERWEIQFLKDFRYIILGSGSSANSYYFENSKWGFVIDNGYSLREFKKRAEKAQIDLKKVRFVLLTHVHGDHLKGVGDLARFLGVPVVHHSDLELKKILKGALPPSYSMLPGKEYELDSCRFRPFSLHHDAPHAMSFHVDWEGVRFTLLTDTGCTNPEMLELASRSHIVFLESNYCPQLLKDGPYPWPLKNRISGNLGHLSNFQARDFLNEMVDLYPAHQVKRVYLVHLSETNNDPEVVSSTLKAGLRHQFDWKVCPKSALVFGEPVTW